MDTTRADPLAGKLEEGLEDYLSVKTKANVYATTPHLFNFSIFHEIEPIQQWGKKIETAMNDQESLVLIAKEMLNSKDNNLKFCIAAKIVGEPVNVRFKEPATLSELARSSYGQQLIDRAKNWVDSQFTPTITPSHR